MRRLLGWQGCRGFTLVEVLVVMAILGIFMMAVYGTYVGNQRTATSQQEVAEVQQNLRVGMEQLSKDLLNAGYLTGPTQNVTGTATTLTVVQGSASVRNPRIVASKSDMQMILKAGGGWLNDGFGVGAGCFPVSSRDDLADLKKDKLVRIIVPQNFSDPYGTNVGSAGSVFRVTGDPPATDPPRVCLDLAATAVPPSEEIIYLPGNIIVSTSLGAPYPNAVTYALDANNNLTRSGVIIAENISAIQFQYQLDSGALVNSATVADSVRAVRVTLTSQTVQSARTGGVPPKVRQLVATCGIRN